MSKIIGVTVGTPTSPKKIEEEIKPVKTVNGNTPDENGNVEVVGNNGADGKDGKDGVNGADGKDGADGFSPTLSVSTITGGHRITITDKNGTKNIDVMDGTDGKDGADGKDGSNGTNGADGKSAYQYAQDGGYKGTEAEFAALLANTVDKRKITLGLHVDGLIYIFIDDEPVGNGIALPSGGVSGDVVGNVDSANNIVLMGNLADGTYTVKYEMEDGSTIDIGDLVLGEIEPEEPEINNLFNPDTATYNARLSTNDGSVKTPCNGCVVTDFIDITYINKIILNGTFVDNTTSTNYGSIRFYTADNTYMSEVGVLFDFNPEGWVLDVEANKAKYPSFAKIRVCLGIKESDSITKSDVANVVIAETV